LVKNVDEDIETHQLAVGFDNKMVSLSDDNFTQAKRIVGEGNIPMTTIDSLGLDDVDLIKIDVEGYEMEVLKGAKKVLESCQYVMIELNSNTGKYGSSNQECMNFLESMGYKLLLEHWPDKVYYRAN
jgi:two-component SAPR family response regulator